MKPYKGITMFNANGWKIHSFILVTYIAHFQDTTTQRRSEEKRRGSCCSLPMDQRCALHDNIKKVCEECKLPLLWPDWNVISANVLIHFVNSFHVPTVLVNREGLFDVHRLLVSPWPSLRHPQRFNAITVRCHRDHTVVIPSRDHDFSCQILPVAICSASSSFPPTSQDILSVRWNRTLPVTWRSILHIYEADSLIYEADSCPQRG